MSKIKIYSLFVVLGLCADFARAAERTLSLSDAVALALQNNVAIKLAQANTEEARARVRQSAAGLLPNLVGSASQARVFKTNLAAEGFPSDTGLPFPTLIGPYNVFDARLTLTQKILDLNLFRTTRSLRAQEEAVQWQEKLTEDQVTSAAALAYIEAQRSSSAVLAAQSDYDLSNTLFKQTEDQHRDGTATGVDEARAQTRLAEDQVRLIRAHVDARQAAIRLARVCVISLQDSLKLTDSLATVPVDTATLVMDVPFAWDHRFEVHVAQAQVHADHEALGAARADFLPTIKASGDYGYSGNLPDGSARTGSIRGELELPIFTGGSTLAEIRQARAQKTAADANLLDVRNQVEEDVDISHDTLVAAIDELHATELEIQLATRELQMARDRFSAGVGDNIQLLSAQTALETARESQINALASYHIARVNWAMALGTISAFHL